MARVSRREKKPPVVESGARVEKMFDLMKGVGDWRPQVQVIQNIKAVPTIFPQFDRATRIGGSPIARTIVLHGPSNHGKTLFLLGLGISYLQKKHLFAVADAERTLTQQWVGNLMGSHAASPHFSALPVTTFENLRDNVRRYCDRLIELRDKGDVDPETTALIAVDSVRKLVPERAWENLGKDLKKPKSKKSGIDGFGGRTGQLRAALLAAWMDELCPLMAWANASIVLVSRENEVEGTDFFKTPQVKVGGGKAMEFEPALRVRVTRGFVYREVKKEKGDEETDHQVVGEKHTVTIEKTKIGSKGEEKKPKCWFHTSNGVLVPEGFDRARDLVDLGLRLGVLTQPGNSHVKWGKTSLGAGVHAAVKRLHMEPNLAVELEAELRAQD